MEQRKRTFLVDENTGEICGHADIEQDFVPDTPERVDWVLRTMMELESQIVGRKAELQALQDNAKAILSHHQVRLDWLKEKYTDALEHWAEGQLEGELDDPKGQRSVKRPFGTLVFRVPTGKGDPALAVADGKLEQAVEWAKANVPEAVKTVETILVMPLKPKIDDLPLDLFDVTYPARSFSAKTGVK